MAPALQAIEKTVHSLVLEELDESSQVTRLASDYDLVGGGILDSVGIFRVLVAIEDEYGIKVPDEEIRLDTIDTISAIARLVESHLEARE